MSDNSNAQTSMGELLVYQSSRGESTPLFRVTGNQGSQWLLATVSSSISSSERVRLFALIHFRIYLFILSC